MIIETHSAEETFRLGEELGRKARPGQVYCLNGDLGVGKTVLTQGFAAGLGIEGPVSSPTFTILQEYPEGRIPLYHFDVYRLAEAEELDEIGFDDYLNGDGVCLIEWAERFPETIPSEAGEIRIEKDLSRDFSWRRITVREPAGPGEYAER